MKKLKCKCGSTNIVNKHFNLCFYCNNERLHGNKYGKQTARINIKEDLVLRKIKEDEDFYEKCFDASKHVCEECGCKLNTVFRGEDNRVLCRWRYAHRLPKSVYPEYRHKLWNIVNLCLDCHTKYDFGDKSNMKVWKETEEIVKGLKSNNYGTRDSDRR